MLKRLFIFAALLLLPLGAQAADGDACALDATTKQQETGGRNSTCVLVCDDGDSTGDCTDVDVRGSRANTGTGPHNLYPDKVHFFIGNTTGCADPTAFTVTPHFSYTSASTDIDFSSTAMTTNNKVSEELEFPGGARYVNATIGGTVTDCTDIELIAVFSWEDGA
ncbi:MAG: hypothetical protein GY737_00325 [Desulfobacteraceae bacterium]|nr:hypothetical protein [Desulfobacteraceae bacterium]